MAQSLARDEQGNIWDVSDPKNPRFVSAGQSPIHSAFAAPTLPYQGPQAQTNLAKSQVETQIAQDTAAAQEQKAKNEAVSSGIKVKSDQVDLNMKTGTPPGDLTKTGQAYLATLPPGVGDLTREMLNGNYKGSITTSRNPIVMQAALAAAHATNGNFDAGKYDERLALIKSLTDPNSQLGALNTALAHAGVLYDQAANVAGGTWFGHTPLSTAVNAVENWWQGNSPAVANYEGTVGKYGPEQAKAYGIGTGGERQGIEQQYSVNLPLDTKRSLLSNDARLYAGKIASLAHGYDMLGANNPLDYLSPDAKDALAKIDPQTYQKIFGAASGAQQNGASIPPVGPSGPGNPPTGDVNPNGGMGAAQGYTSHPDTQGAAFVDNLVRQRVPYAQAAQQYTDFMKQRGYPNATPFAPSQYNAAVKWAQSHPNLASSYNPAIAASIYDRKLNAGEQLLSNVAASGPGVLTANAANAATAGLPVLAAGDQGQFYQQYANAAHPNYALAGDVAGTIAGISGVNKGLKAGAEAAQDLPIFGRVARGLLDKPGIRGMVANDLYGGAYGAASNPDHPFIGGAAGALTAQAGDSLGRFLIAPAGRAVAGKAGGMFGYRAPLPLNSGDAAIVKPLSTPDAISGVQQNLTDAANLNLPYSLADASPQLRALAGSAARKSPDVMALGNNTLNPRALGQADRAIEGITKNLAQPGDLKTMLADARARAQQISQPFYEQAFNAPAPNDSVLNDVLRTPDGEEAVRRAYRIALNRGENPAELDFSVDSSGDPIINAKPNFKTLHYTKMGLDSLVEDKRDPVTGVLNLNDPWTQSVDMLRRQFRGRLGELNPAYAQANEAYANAVGNGSAAEAGYGATAPSVTPTQAQNGFANQSPDNAPFFQRGFASNMADTVNNTRFSTNPMARIYGSPAQQAKVASIFPNGAQNFGRLAQLENDMSATRNEVLGGSQTAARTQADKMFDNLDIGVDLAKAAATHGASIPFDLAMTGARKAGNGLFNRMSLAKADQIGPILLNQDPLGANAAINDMLARNAAYQRYLTASRNYGGMFGASTLLPFIPQGQ
jgi:hypothetical protein